MDGGGASGSRPRVGKRVVFGAGCVIGGPLSVLAGFRLLDGEIAVLFVLGGSVAPVVGFTLLVPAAVAVAERTAERLPRPLRPAAWEHGHRYTATAVLAVLLIAAALTASAIGVASDIRAQRLDHGRLLPLGHTIVHEVDAETAPDVLSAVERELPGVPVTRIDKVREPTQGEDRRWFDHVKTGDRCATDPCDGGRWEFSEALVADPWEARLLVGDEPEVVSALASGKAVVYVPGVVRDGVARFETGRWDENGQPVVLRAFDLPAVYATPALDSVPNVILPRSAAVRAGLEIEPAMLLIDTPLDEERSGRLDRAVAEVTDDRARAYTEQGFDGSDTHVLAVWGLVAAALIPGVVLLTAGSAAQAGFVSLLGCGLGLLAGAPAGASLAVALTLPPGPGSGVDRGPLVDVPWPLLLGGGAAVSLAAALLAHLLALARSRLRKAP